MAYFQFEPWNRLQWNLNRNLYVFIPENALENVVWKMSAILSRPRCKYMLLHLQRNFTWIRKLQFANIFSMIDYCTGLYLPQSLHSNILDLDIVRWPKYELQIKYFFDLYFSTSTKLHHHHTAKVVDPTRTTRMPVFWDTPRRPMIIHTSDSHLIQSQNKTKSKLQN